ncbi:transposable element Tcb1 transposase [Trichonephila clavipes]|nr:transposable element Tcb1 transposase [Trichonephila clavipes]
MLGPVDRRGHSHENQAQNTLDRPVVEKTASTIQKCLAKEHLGSRCPLRVLPLTPTTQRLRLNWCLARRICTAAEWNQVVLSNVCESRLNLSSDDNRVRAWRPRAERLIPASALQRHTALTYGVMGLRSSTIIPSFIENYNMVSSFRSRKDMFAKHKKIMRLNPTFFKPFNGISNCSYFEVSGTQKIKNILSVIVCPGYVTLKLLADDRNFFLWSPPFERHLPRSDAPLSSRRERRTRDCIRDEHLAVN